MIYTACKSLAKWWGMFLGTSHFDLEGWQKNPPVGFLGSAPPGITNNLKKIESLYILNGFERSIHLWIGKDIYNFTKIAAILNFHVNMPPSWILCFWTFLKKNIFLLRVHHCTIYVVNSDAAYSAQETINKINLLSLPIKSLL